MAYKQLVDKPVPIWIVNGNHTPSSNDAPIADVAEKLVRDGDWPQFRGVSFDRLRAVLETGVDVEPTDAPIFCSDIEKAWEYGGSPLGEYPRIVYGLRGSLLENSWRRLPLDATPGEIAKARLTYPYQHEEESCLWLSRIAEKNRNLVYEADCGYWIPGNAKDALVAVFIIVPPDQIADFLLGKVKLPPKAPD